MNWRDVDMKLIMLNESKVEKAYKAFYGGYSNINLALDDVVPVKKKEYARLLQVGYMRLLSNQK
jgi:hypothetical protein